MVLERCPACRAKMTGDEEEDQPCRRCGSDLVLLRRTFERARQLRARARRALARGDDLVALELAHRAVALVDAPETRATLCAALVALGRPLAALAVVEPRRS